MKLQNSFRDYTAESALFVRRALVAFLGILLLTGVLIANLYNLQIVRFTDYQTRSNENRIKLVPIAPSRGIIYDRNGKEYKSIMGYVPREEIEKPIGELLNK